MGNPLFEHYNERRKQDDARQRFGETKLGRLLMSSAVPPGAKSLGRFADGMRSLATDREKYGSFSNMLRNIVFGQVAKALGPIGNLVSALIRPSGKALTKSIDKELLAAAQLLEAFGYAVKKPGQETSQPTLTPPKPKQKPTPPIPIPVVGGTGGGRRGLARVGGGAAGIPPDDPLLTGEMIQVDSSNVHSIGYDWNEAKPQLGTLKVRFLMPVPGNPKAKKIGALYYYINVPPEVFQAFRAAASMGKFVWDKLRIRGTVSGHQYYYYLAGIRSGYVPRQARRINGEEWFVRRNVRGENGNVYQSRLDDEQVSGRSGTPSRGAPNRGQPNRGTPNRGRYPGPRDQAGMN
jgi:hypothetical protein